MRKSHDTWMMRALITYPLKQMQEWGKLVSCMSVRLILPMKDGGSFGDDRTVCCPIQIGQGALILREGRASSLSQLMMRGWSIFFLINWR